MPISQFGSADRKVPLLSGLESARYTRDMLESLRGIALGQKQMVLVHLLDAARRETERLLREKG